MNDVIEKFDLKVCIEQLDKQSSFEHRFQENFEKGMRLSIRQENILVQFIGGKIKELWGDW